MRIRTKTRSEKASRTRKRNANPLLAAKRVAERPQPAVKVYKISGREVCAKTPEGKAEYRARVELMVERQKHLCCICGFYLSFEDATFEHGGLRGMGGGRRNDSTSDPKNGAAHGSCNGQKGSVRTERTGRLTL